MPGKLLQELQQTKPVRSTTAEAFLNVLRTAEVLTQQLAELLRPYGVSTQQYNVMRILRGAGPDGIPSGQISERMVNRDPDVTRLVDRLEKQGLAERVRGGEDRRVVRVRATRNALDLLGQLDEPVEELHACQFAGLSEERVTMLISSLEELR